MMKNNTFIRFFSNKFKAPLANCWLMFLLALASLPAMAEAVDNRQVLNLSEPQRLMLLTEMRELLTGTQAIIGALAEEDMTAVAKYARALGFEMKHQSENPLHQILPKAFMQLGMPMHKEFDLLAADAETLKNPKHTLQQLSATMAACGVCHATYQIRTTPVASEARLDEVAERGSLVMPFNLEQTTHVFSKAAKGGVQQVIVKDATNTEQIKLIREHLTKISEEFKKGDFSNPIKIHGNTMPGLAELSKAKPGEISILYKELPNGAEINYSTNVPILINAIHQWFDAQLTDHARHARAGQAHHKMQ